MGNVQCFHAEDCLGDLANNTPPGLARRTHDQLTANVNNLEVTAESYDLIQLSADADGREISGIVAPTTQPKLIGLYIGGTKTVVLKHASVSSDAANRMTALGGSDVTMQPGELRFLYYDATENSWHISEEVPRKRFKLEITADGACVVLNRTWWSVENLGYYDAAGTDTANAVDLFFREGPDEPILTLAGSSAAERASLTIGSGSDEILQPSRENRLGSIVFVPNSGILTVEFRANEALNR